MDTQSLLSVSPSLPPLLPHTERAMAQLMAAPAVAAALTAAERDAAAATEKRIVISTARG